MTKMLLRLDPGDPFVAEETMVAGVCRLRRSTLVERWFKDGEIDQGQKDAAKIFWDDFNNAMLPRDYATVNFDKVSGGGQSENAVEYVLAAKKRVGNALGAIGLLYSSAIWDIIGLEMTISDHIRRLRWRGLNMDRRTAKSRTIQGLTALKEHYRIP